MLLRLVNARQSGRLIVEDRFEETTESDEKRMTTTT